MMVLNEIFEKNNRLYEVGENPLNNIKKDNRDINVVKRNPLDQDKNYELDKDSLQIKTVKGGKTKGGEKAILALQELVNPRRKNRLKKIIKKRTSYKLFEEEKKGESEKYKGYYHRGGGYYSRQPDGEITHQSVEGQTKLKLLSPAERKKKNANDKSKGGQSQQQQQPSQRNQKPAQVTTAKQIIDLMTKSNWRAKNGKPIMSDIIRESDPSIIDAIMHGFNKVNDNKGNQIWKPAPGSATSLFNEVFSVVSMNVISEARSKGGNPNIDEVKKVLRTMYPPKKYGIWSVGDEKKQEEVLDTTVRAAFTKSRKIGEVIDANIKNLGGSAKMLQYYGTDVSLQNQYDLLMETKNNGNAKLFDPTGNEITDMPDGYITLLNIMEWNKPDSNEKFSYDEAQALVADNPPETKRERLFQFYALALKNGGGGLNPSDTVTILQGKNGSLAIQAWSDKTSIRDQQGNTTVNKQFESFAKSINVLEAYGYEFSEKNKRIFAAMISEIQQDYMKTEKQLLTVAGAPAIEVLENWDANRDLIADVASNLSSRGHQYFASDGKNSVTKSIAWGNKTKQGGSIVWDEFLEKAGADNPPTDEQKMQAIFHLLSDERTTQIENPETGEVEDVSYGVAHLSGATISRTTSLFKGIHQRGREWKGEVDNIDVMTNIERIKKDSIEKLQSFVDRLNDWEVDNEDGSSTPFGSAMAAVDLMKILHFYGAYDQENREGLYHSNLINIIANDDIVDHENMRHCLGVDNPDDFIKSVRAEAVGGESESKKGFGVKFGDTLWDESQLSRAPVTAKDPSRQAKSRSKKTGNINYGYYTLDENGNPSGYAWLEEGFESAEIQKRIKDGEIKAMGDITGRKVLVYVMDKEGKKRELATMTYRGKGGPQSKLDPIYSFGKDFQDCISSRKPTSKNEAIKMNKKRQLKPMKHKTNQELYVEALGVIADIMERQCET